MAKIKNAQKCFVSYLDIGVMKRQKKYMTIGKVLKLSFIWDKAGLSSSIRLEVIYN